MNKIVIPLIVILAIAAAGYTLFRGSNDMTPPETTPSDESVEAAHPKLATFGGGCFWCTEAAFQQLDGVQSVVSGYSGGQTLNPTYEDICTGTTGHAEVVQVTYDPTKLTFRELIEVFFAAHDPTTLNQQGADIGTQYRSVIFFHDDAQRDEANLRISQLDAADMFPSPIVTEVSPLETFYPAEVSHQDYYARNSRQPYCQMVVAPKVEKVRKLFADKIRDAANDK